MNPWHRIKKFNTEKKQVEDLRRIVPSSHIASFHIFLCFCSCCCCCCFFTFHFKEILKFIYPIYVSITFVSTLPILISRSPFLPLRLGFRCNFFSLLFCFHCRFHANFFSPPHHTLNFTAHGCWSCFLEMVDVGWWGLRVLQEGIGLGFDLHCTPCKAERRKIFQWRVERVVKRKRNGKKPNCDKGLRWGYEAI